MLRFCIGLPNEPNGCQSNVLGCKTITSGIFQYSSLIRNILSEIVKTISSIWRDRNYLQNFALPAYLKEQNSDSGSELQ